MPINRLLFDDDNRERAIFEETNMDALERQRFRQQAHGNTNGDHLVRIRPFIRDGERACQDVPNAEQGIYHQIDVA